MIDNPDSDYKPVAEAMAFILTPHGAGGEMIDGWLMAVFCRGYPFSDIGWRCGVMVRSGCYWSGRGRGRRTVVPGVTWHGVVTRWHRSTADPRSISTDDFRNNKYNDVILKQEI